MIELSAAALSVLGRSFRYYVRVESWLADQLLSDDVPVDQGYEENDATLRIPERVTLTVPRLYRGETWSPVGDDHPLAANGQRLRVQLGIGLASGQIEWFNRGWFLIQDVDPQGVDSITVQGVGLLTYIDEARLVSPLQPTGTLASTLRDLVEPALTVDLDPALVDRSVPASINYDDDRLGAVLQLFDAWPATAVINPDGYLALTVPADDATPVLSVTDQSGGTAIAILGSSSRDGAANAVVARGTATDGGQVQGVAYDYGTGPKAIGGPFNPLPVPEFFESPLLTTVAQCQAAARTRLARRVRQTARAFTVDMVPHPALLPGDVVAITTADVAALPCRIESMRLPYRGSGGSHTMVVREVTT